MITAQDLDAAIAECQGKRNPDASTCIKLAAFYTIRREMFGEEKNADSPAGYSYSADPTPGLIDNPNDSEFARMIDGRKQEEVWPLMDEMMDTIAAIHPKLYRAVMERLR